MEYLKKFDNHTSYESIKSNLILPNVSFCVQQNEVHYNPYVDPYNGHAYVDLGLPSGLKWATMNIGATIETDYGLYFQFGDTSGYTQSEVGSGIDKKHFYWSDYKFNPSGNGSTFTKYNTTDKKKILDLEDDAAHVNMGGDWRMPTNAEFQELIDNTNNEFTTINGVNGYKFTSRIDGSKYIFIPAAGYFFNGSVESVGSYGYYWCSSLNTSPVSVGCSLQFYNSYINIHSYDRCDGFPVRGVAD